jgi:hypothetical protein
MITKMNKVVYILSNCNFFLKEYLTVILSFSFC